MQVSVYSPVDNQGLTLTTDASVNTEMSEMKEMGPL